MRGQPQASPALSEPAGGLRRAAIPPGPGGARRQDVARPLPDPVAIRLCRVPDAAPPYDDESPDETGAVRADVLAAAIAAALDAGGRPGGAVGVQPAGGPRSSSADSRRLRPAREPGIARQARTARQAGGASQPGSAGQPGTAGRAGKVTPGPGGWPGKFAQVLAETLAGSRPPAQMTPWTTERARSHIRRLGPMLTAGQQPLVQRIITSVPAADVMEMSVVVGFGPRVRALAVRLERTQSRPATPGHAGTRSRWLCTAVEAA